MNLANLITFYRIVIIPFFVFFMIEQKPLLPLFLFSVAIITDGLDGMTARLQKKKTRLGSILDPLADKLLICSAYVTLTALRMLPLWVVVIVFSRDILLLSGWLVVYFSHRVSTVIPSILGKATTVLQMAMVLFILLCQNGFLPEEKWLMVKPLFVAVMVLFTVISGMDYGLRGVQLLNKEIA